MQALKLNCFKIGLEGMTMKTTVIIFILVLVLYTGCGERNPLFNLLEPEEFVETDESDNDYWITEVIEYKPAWGQHVNNTSFNDINKLYGPPKGNGTMGGGLDVVSLGSGGGYLVVQFDPPVLNDSKNIKGYDFIVFGNAYWTGGNPDSHWQEPAYVEVMKDSNGNGLPDDIWYLLKPSDTTPGDFMSLTNSRTNTNYKPINKSEYPDTAYFPGYPDEIIFQFFRFPSAKAGQTGEEIWGYADVTPTLKPGDMSGANGISDNSLSDSEDNPDIAPGDFYTIPDTHGDLYIDAGSGGGDAFKIEWAVDRNTGAPVSLDKIDFIKITSTATNTDAILKDVSADIDAIARVKTSE